MPTALSMPSIRYIFRSGRGPSSSHTIAPFNAAKHFLGRNPNAESFRVTLYGSLAATHAGHMTDKAIKDAFSPRNVEFKFKEGSYLAKHPNGMMFEALDPKRKAASTWMAYSVGGGAIMDDHGYIGEEGEKVYPTASMSQILEKCRMERISLYHYVEFHENKEIGQDENKSIRAYMKQINQNMKDTIRAGVTTTGILPGPLKVQRKAKFYHDIGLTSHGPERDYYYLFAYALACAEENAAGNPVVTAPTCGSSGVLPAVINFMKNTDPKLQDRDDLIIHALETAGLIGNLAKINASISGAEVGCQGEIGVASAMAAAAAAQLMGGNIFQVEYAAEIALEHRLGLTCDPVCGYVQVPCIERNATAAQTAYADALYALGSDGNHLVSFDTVLSVMKKTGKDMQDKYKETAKGGLAAEIKL